MSWPEPGLYHLTVTREGSSGALWRGLSSAELCEASPGEGEKL